MQVRDQWPLVALSVTHALLHHVDELTVLLHRTTDGSSAGLGQLRERWGEALRVLHYEGAGFQQEAVTNGLIAASGLAPGDWVYVLDADEFLLVEPGRSLRDLLAELDPAVAAVRYEVHNWVAPMTLDEAHLDGYRGVRARAVPTLFGDLDDSVRADQVARGLVNFFDVPFASKVLMRAGGWVSAGTHSVVGIAPDEEVTLGPSTLRAAHLPFPSRDRLEARALNGERLIREGHSAGHGWQNQMLWRLKLVDALDAFWQAHSLGGSAQAGWVEPVVVRDDELAEALQPSLGILQDAFGPVLPRDPAGAGVGAVEAVDFGAVVELARQSQERAETASRRVEDSARQASERVASLTARVDALLAENAELAARCAELDGERQSLAGERDRADSRAAALDEIVGSRSWRLTAGLRRSMDVARRVGGRDAASGAPAVASVSARGTDGLGVRGTASGERPTGSTEAGSGVPLVGCMLPATVGPVGWSTTCRVVVEGWPLWFTADRDITPVGEAFATALLPAALMSGRPLHIDAPLSATWVSGALEIGRLASRWWGWSQVEVRGSGVESRPAPSPDLGGRGIGLAFSGGVDSFHALLTSPDPIDLLVSAWGFDIRIADEVRWRSWDAALEQVGGELGIDIARVRTNVRDHPVSSAPGWVRSHGSALAALGHLMSGSIHEFRVASTNPTSLSASTWGSNWVMDPLWSSDRLRISHVGEELWRSAKLEAIAEHPLVQRHLRVCWENRDSAPYNCGACEKCVRTQVTLESLELRGSFPGFPRSRSLVELVDALAPCASAGIVAEYEQVIIPGSAGSVRGALERFVARSHAAGVR